MEEAQAKVGGDDNLQRAVSQGRVMVRGERGRELYYFPRVSSGKQTEWNVTSTAEREQSINNDSYVSFAKDHGELMDAVGTGEDLDALMVTYGLEDGEVPDGDITKTLEEMEEKLTKLIRAGKLADAASKDALKISGKSQKMRFALNDLQDTQEHAEKLKVDVQFEIRFHKDKEGVGLTILAVTRRSNQIDDCTVKLVEDVKCLRALVPKAITNGIV